MCWYYCRKKKERMSVVSSTNITVYPLTNYDVAKKLIEQRMKLRIKRLNELKRLE